MRLIYLASPWCHRKEAKDIADQLRAAGHQVVSRWHDVWGVKSEEGLSVGDLQDEAEMDLADVRACDVLLQIHKPGSTGGMFIEQGYAMRAKTPIVIVGSPEHVFQYVPGVIVVNSLGAALDAIAGLP